MAFNKGKGNWKKHTKEGYNKNFQKKKQAKKRDEHYLSKFKGRNIEVRNGDVNGAIKRLKKVLPRLPRWYFLTIPITLTTSWGVVYYTGWILLQR